MLTMQRTLGASALLAKTIQEITDSAYKVFFDTLEAQGRSLLRFLHPPEPDLAAPLALRDFGHVLREIMTDYKRSLTGEETAQEASEGFTRILDTSLEPALEMCRRMADLMQGSLAAATATSPGGERTTAHTWDQNVFLINCYVYLQVCFSDHSMLLMLTPHRHYWIRLNLPTIASAGWKSLSKATSRRSKMSTCVIPFSRLEPC